MKVEELRDYQEHLLTQCLNIKFLQRVAGVLEPDVFDPDIAEGMKFALQCFRRSKSAPTLAQLKRKVPDLFIRPIKDECPIDFDVDNVELMVREFHMNKMLLEVRTRLDTGKLESAEAAIQHFRVGVRLDDSVTWDCMARDTSVVGERGKPVPTGLPTLDEQLNGGICPGEVAIVMGETNVGKTSFLLNLAAHAVSIGKNVFFCSLEQPAHSVQAKFQAAMAKRGNNRKKLGKIRALANQPYSITVSGLLSHVERCPFPADIIILDSLDLLRPTRRWGNKWEEEAETALVLKAMTMERDTRLWTSTQANRDGYSRERLTGTGNVKGSIDKVQLVDQVLSLNQPTGDTLPDPMMGNTHLRLYVAKNRFGPRGLAMDLNCWLAECRFEEAGV